MTAPTPDYRYCQHLNGRRQHIRLTIPGAKPAAVTGVLFGCPRCQLFEFRPDEMPEGWAKVGAWDWGLINLGDIGL